MIPVQYSYRNVLVRWKTTLMTASGFTLVVGALIVMLAFYNGINAVTVVTGDPANVIVLKEGQSDESLSALDHRLVFQVEMTPGILRRDDDRLLASRELFMSLTPPRPEDFQGGLLQARGVTPVAIDVHPGFHLREGRMFRRNHREVIIGAGLAREQGLGLGDKIPVGRKEWDIVGVFEAGGSTYESEFWCDVTQLAAQFNREGVYSTVVLRFNDPYAAQRGADYLNDNRLFEVDALPEPLYYQEQAKQTEVIRVGAIVIAVFMSIGAVLGVTNTMYAAIGQRTKDIAVLRLFGYKPYEILICFLIEAMLIALVGGLLGSALGYFVNGITLNTALGGKQVAFAFKVDAATMLIAGAFTLAIGLLGGILPALTAMRVKPIEALR